MSTENSGNNLEGPFNNPFDNGEMKRLRQDLEGGEGAFSQEEIKRRKKAETKTVADTLRSPFDEEFEKLSTKEIYLNLTKDPELKKKFEELGFYITTTGKLAVRASEELPPMYVEGEEGKELIRKAFHLKEGEQERFREALRAKVRELTGLAEEERDKEEAKALENVVASSESLEELTEGLRTLGKIPTSSGYASAENTADWIQELSGFSPEELGSREKLERMLAKRGVTRVGGLRAKVIDFLMSSERSEAQAERGGGSKELKEDISAVEFYDNLSSDEKKRLEEFGIVKTSNDRMRFQAVTPDGSRVGKWVKGITALEMMRHALAADTEDENRFVKDEVYRTITHRDLAEDEEKAGIEEEETEETEEEEASAEKSPEELEKASLEDLRRAYIEMRNLRGLVVRRGKVKVSGLVFKARDPRAIEYLRDAYNSKLVAEIGKGAEEFLKSEGVSSDTELTPEQKALLYRKIAELMEHEQEVIDETIAGMIEGNLRKKFKELWKSKGGVVGRIGAGIGLAGVAATGGLLGVIGAGVRMGLSGFGTYMSVEGILERRTGLGQKGLINKIIKETKGFKSDDEIWRYIKQLSRDEVKNEVARLKALQSEKMVSLEEAGVLSGKAHDQKVLSFLIKKNYAIVAVEAVNANPRGAESAQVSGAISNYLDSELKVRSEVVESEGEAERKKKLTRRLIAAGAGATVGMIIGSKYFEAMEASVGDAGAPVEAATDEGFVKETTPFRGIESIADDGPNIVSTSDSPPPLPEVFENLTAEVGEGDNLWSIIEDKLGEAGLFDELETEGQKTYLIDAIKDRFAEMSPEELEEVGISSGDIDRLQVGDEIDLSKVLGDDEVVSKWAENAGDLSDEAIKSIEANNETIAEWHKAHPDAALDAETVGKVIETNGSYTPEAVAQEASEAANDNISETGEAGESITSPEKFELAQAIEIAKEADRVEKGIITEAFGEISGEEWEAVKEWEGVEFIEHDLNPDVESPIHKHRIQFQNRLRKLRDLSGTYPRAETYFREAETVGEYLKRAAKTFAEDKIKNAPPHEWLNVSGGKTA